MTTRLLFCHVTKILFFRPYINFALYGSFIINKTTGLWIYLQGKDWDKMFFLPYSFGFYTINFFDIESSYNENSKSSLRLKFIEDFSIVFTKYHLNSQATKTYV